MDTSGAAFKMTGDHHLWPEQWATDSLRKAVNTKVYPATLKNSVQAAHGGRRAIHGGNDCLPREGAAYVDGHSAAGAEQLLKAAVRLADLLNAIAQK